MSEIRVAGCPLTTGTQVHLTGRHLVTLNYNPASSRYVVYFVVYATHHEDDIDLCD